MPVPPRPLPEALGDEFSTAEALAAGATPRRLRAKDLGRPFHGVRLRPYQPDSEDERPLTKYELARRDEARKARAYRTVMSPNAFFAGRSAGVLLGAAIDPGPELVVAVHAPNRAPRGTGIHGMKVLPKLADIREHDGMRMTSPSSTWAMLGAELSVRELVAVGDSIVRGPRDERGTLLPAKRLGTIEELQRVIVAGRWVGIASLRTALPLIRVGSASPLETDYRLDASRGGLPEPDLDVEIRNGRGDLLGISEVVYARYRTVVEIEGDHHRIDRKQWNRDIDKYAAYAAEGWEVVRLTAEHIRGRQPRAVRIVKAVLLRRGWTPE